MMEDLTFFVDVQGGNDRNVTFFYVFMRERQEEVTAQQGMTGRSRKSEFIYNEEIGKLD